MSDLKKVISDIIDQTISQVKFDNVNILLCTQEGIPVYHRLNKSVTETCTLAAGVWQASNAITKTLTSNMNEFRYSYDSTDSGIYILGIAIHKRDYLVIMTYSQIENPAKQKMKLRFLRDKIENQQSDILDNDSGSAKHGYLFDNITDEEMDKLFGQVGN